MTRYFCMSRRLGYLAALFALMSGAAWAQEQITLERIGAVRMAPSGSIESDIVMLAEAFRFQARRAPDEQDAPRLEPGAEPEGANSR